VFFLGATSGTLTVLIWIGPISTVPFGFWLTRPSEPPRDVEQDHQHRRRQDEAARLR
jgi:hypothetical protein